MRTLKTIACLLVLMLCLSGCQRMTELSDYAFVVTMSLDAVNDGQLRVGLQILAGTDRLDESSSGSAGGTGGGTSQTEPGAELKRGSYLLVSADGQDFFQALLLLEATIPRRVNFTHLSQIIVSEELARSDALKLLLSDIMGTFNIRNSAYLVIAKGQAMEVLSNQLPYLGARLSEYLSVVMRNGEENGFIPVTPVSDVLSNMGNDQVDSAVTYVAVNHYDANMPLTPNRTLDDLPGNLPNLQINNVEYLGAALINSHGMVGLLTGMNSQLLHLLFGHNSSAFYTLDNTYFRLTQRKGISREVRWEPDGSVTLYAKLRLNAYPVRLYVPTDEKALASAIRDDMEALVLELQALKCDPLGYGMRAVAHYPNNAAWEASGWRDRYHTAKLDIQVEVVVIDQ